MTEREMQQHIATLQRWLAGAWRRLGDPSLTPFDKRELRNQMKQADASLRRCLALSVELKSAQRKIGTADVRAFAKPDLRFLA
jgi:hypothetical protein